MVEKNSHRTKFLLLNLAYTMLKYQFQNGREGNAFEDIPEDLSWQDLINLLGDKEKVRELSASFNN